MSDAYEVSFVAVPAQPRAGTIKNYTGEEVIEEETKKTLEEDETSMDLNLDLIGSFLFGEKEGEYSYE